MSTTRRAFLIATGASGLLWTSFGLAAQASTRTWIVDEALPQSRVLVRQARMTGARLASLSGDAGWLWFERLSEEAMSTSHAIGGLTRFADAFVLAQLGAGIGMRATHHRAFDDGAVLWTLERC
ncbi:hypothetical protein CR51_15040 [Caballeronia megalochromosomata]|nr:hypothetical protein CR51_15040 [Caballeronia megalochromosomata]